MADLVPIPFSLQSYGLDQTVTLNVPPLIDGKGQEEFHRNTKEVEAIERIVGKLAGSGISEQITGVEQLVKDRIDKINDPLGYTMLKAKEKAMQPDAPGIMTAIGEFGDILPGGDPFEPGKIAAAPDNYHSWGCKFQSGVFAVVDKPDILNLWAEACREPKNRGDQEILWDLVKHRQTLISLIPEKYNWPRLALAKGKDNDDKRIIHWTGHLGKKHIEQLIKK